MECNRDEALRARDIAEKKYAMQDFAGAKKFVLKAQQLFPGLEGLSQMLPVLEVHSVAQVKVGGTEMDWYGILQVEPGADDATIKKQYRKLALLLHPDKNKAVGAEAAFKLLGEAWGILADKTKRHLHDMRRGLKIKVSQARVVSAEANVSFPTSYHGASATHPSPPPVSTFWTSCPRCKMQYQYLRTYENHQLQCHKCKEVFKARDIQNNSANGSYAWAPYAEAQRQQDFNFAKMGGFNGVGVNGFANGSLGAFPSSYVQQSTNSAANVFSPAAAAAAAASKVAAAAAAASSAVPPNNVAAGVVQQTFQKVKRDRVEAEKETKRKEKEQRRKEAEDRRKEQRKQRETGRLKEAMERLMAKRKEREEAECKRKTEAKPSRRLKRKKRGSEVDEEEEIDEEELKLSEDLPQDEPIATEMPRRRSSRAKRNVSTYKVDVSDSDLEDFPSAKRTKTEGAADSENSGRDRLEEKNDSQQCENGGRVEKGKSIALGEKWHSGINGEGMRALGEKGHRLASSGVEEEPNREGQVPQTDAYTPEESSRRHEDSLREDNSKGGSKSRTGRSSQKVDSSPKEEKPKNPAGEEDEKRCFKAEETRREKSPSKSPRTLRTRSKSLDSAKQTSLADPQQADKDNGTEVEPEPQQRVSSPAASSSFSDDEEQIDVPDPDFHDFDARRTESDIIAGQIWAIYDDQDGMPRFYGRISRVSLSPFKVNLSWLEPTNATEDCSAWMNETGLSITCGEFKIGKSIISEQINIFSHMVLDKAGKGSIKIYPRKSEVWAIYRDWDLERMVGPKQIPKSKGEGHTYAYEMVEVLSDFSEEKGVKTVKLVKVKGFKTLFHKQEGPASTKLFRPSELPRFSHCVISEKMYKDDTLGVPSGALELDPASTPMDLILGSSDQSR